MPPQTGLLYQPVPFPGFEQLGAERNSSEDRYRFLRRKVDYRDARVLDLGCANGFFLFRLAQDGVLSHGRGLDHFKGNIATNALLADLHGLSDVLEFEHASIDSDAIQRRLQDDSWDVCHLLSVHHHLVRDVGFEETRELIRRLYEGVGTLVLEQGSLTQAEYEEWTGRDEPFATHAISRLTSMLEACGIPEERCFIVGMGRYLSGARDDREGAGRILVGCSRRPRTDTIRRILRKRHRNGIYMEIVETGDGEIWKTVVAGASLAAREVRGLETLADAPGFPRLLAPHEAGADLGCGLVRMRAMTLREVTPEDAERFGDDLRRQLLERVFALAEHRLLHNEVNSLHLLLDVDPPAAEGSAKPGRLTLLDLETAYWLDEARDGWRAEVFEPNPALGVGAYDRDLHESDDWFLADLLGADRVLGEWGLPPITDDERARYLELLGMIDV